MRKRRRIKEGGRGTVVGLLFDTFPEKSHRNAYAPLSRLDSDQILNEEPHPQVLVAFGLVTTKREPSSPSL